MNVLVVLVVSTILVVCTVLVLRMILLSVYDLSVMIFSVVFVVVVLSVGFGGDDGGFVFGEFIIGNSLKK